MEAAGSRGPEDRIQEAARRTQRLDKYFLLAASLMLAFCAYKWQHTSDELYVAKHTVTQLSQAKHLLSKHLETLERSTEQSHAEKVQLVQQLTALRATNSTLSGWVRRARGQLRSSGQQLKALIRSNSSLATWASQAQRQMRHHEHRLREMTKVLQAAQQRHHHMRKILSDRIASMKLHMNALQQLGAESQEQLPGSSTTSIAPRGPQQIGSTARRAQIDYSAFWARAWTEAQQAAARLNSQSAIAERRRRLAYFPKVYIYKLPAKLSEGWDPERATEPQVFGKRIRWDIDELWRRYADWWQSVSRERRAELSKNIRDTNHYGFTRAMLFRLVNSPRYRTTDPSKADLFFVPIFPLPKRGKVITSTCATVTPEEIQKSLPYLTEATAHKHLFVLSKEHYEGFNCKGWWAAPTGLFSRAMRLAYSTQQPEAKRVDDYYRDERLGGKHYLDMGCTNLFYEKQCAHLTHPNLESVPYISNVHWPAKPPDPVRSDTELAGRLRGPPWSDPAPRRFQMLFLGSQSHGDTRVRRLLWAMCSSYKDPKKCLSQKYDLNSLMLKYMSTFCLEPAGDSPFRRSITDSIALGCIPVFFSSMQEDTYNWLWEDWRRIATVRVNRSSFLRGEIDLHSLLSSIPPELLKLMRSTIAQHARKFTVSMSDDPGDAIHHLLHGALQMSQRLAAASTR